MTKEIAYNNEEEDASLFRSDNKKLGPCGEHTALVILFRVIYFITCFGTDIKGMVLPLTCQRFWMVADTFYHC